MNRLPFHTANLKAIARAGLLGGLLSSCATAPQTQDAISTAQTPVADVVAPEAPKLTMTEWTLLEMRYEEAKAISAQHADVGSQFSVAADNVEVLKTDEEGKPTKIRANGHVFVEMRVGDRATALCDEAEVTTDEVVLKGKPMLMQNSQVAKATSPSTSFRVTDYLKVSGPFDFIRPADVMQSILAAADPLLPTLPENVALTSANR